MPVHKPIGTSEAGSSLTAEPHRMRREGASVPQPTARRNEIIRHGLYSLVLEHPLPIFQRGVSVSITLGCAVLRFCRRWPRDQEQPDDPRRVDQVRGKDRPGHITVLSESGRAVGLLSGAGFKEGAEPGGLSSRIVQLLATSSTGKLLTNGWILAQGPGAAHPPQGLKAAESTATIDGVAGRSRPADRFVDPLDHRPPKSRERTAIKVVNHKQTSLFLFIFLLLLTFETQVPKWSDRDLKWMSVWVVAASTI